MSEKDRKDILRILNLVLIHPRPLSAGDGFLVNSLEKLVEEARAEGVLDKASGEHPRPACSCGCWPLPTEVEITITGIPDCDQQARAADHRLLAKWMAENMMAGVGANTILMRTEMPTVDVDAALIREQQRQKDSVAETEPISAPPVESPSPWISVKDRLPDRTMDCFCCTCGAEGVEVRHGTWQRFSSQGSSGGIKWRSGDWRNPKDGGIHYVTHWMPSPALPEMQAD